MGFGPAELNRRFEIPNIATVVEGNGGLQKVCVNCPKAAGEIYLHGAHVTSWTPAGGREALFLSSQSRWESGRAIRGGVPICFPWFGDKTDDPTAPAHGFVRTKAWELESIVKAGDGVTVIMSTESGKDTKRWWAAEFRLVYRATFASELKLELAVTNTGETAVRFEEALHSYHRVGNALEARVAGLDSIQYIDKADLNQEMSQHGDVVIAAETDRVYLNTGDEVDVQDSVLCRRTRVAKENSLTTVVWNPWVQKAHSLSDLGDDEWKQMICIETSNVSHFAVDLAPGREHTMKAFVRVDEL